MTRSSHWVFGSGVFGLLLALSASVCAAQTADDLDRQRAQYDAVTAKSIVDLQPFRHEIIMLDPATLRQVKFISLNPAVNAWFLLQIETARRGAIKSYHLENPYPKTQSVDFETNGVPTLIFTNGPVKTRCTPLAEKAAELTRALESGLPYAPICGGHLYLRNRVRGSRTNIEAWAEFLRDNV